MSDPLVEGDRVLYWGMADTVTPLFTPSVGDTVTVVPLEHGDSICIPKLEFEIGDYAWHAVDFPFAAFDWKMDFNFELLPLIFSTLWGRLTAVGGEEPGLGVNVLEDRTQNHVADSQIGKYLHILSGYLKDQYFEILDNGTDWYIVPQTSAPLLPNSDCTDPDTDLNWQALVTPGYGCTAYWDCSSTGGKSAGRGHLYVHSPDWHGCAVRLVYNANLSVGSTVSFWAKFNDSTGNPTMTAGIYYFPPGYWIPNTYIVLTKSWVRYTIEVEVNTGIGLEISVSNGTKEVWFCDFTQESDPTMYEMGFRVGDYYEIVDSVP